MRYEFPGASRIDGQSATNAVGHAGLARKVFANVNNFDQTKVAGLNTLRAKPACGLSVRQLGGIYCRAAGRTNVATRSVEEEGGCL